jgi:uncharacterized membrane protein YoaK (UPF0700 family)
VAAETKSENAPKVGPPEPPALLALLVVLTGTTGLVDAVSVLGLGRVFAANMTGNVVFLGFALAGVPEFSAIRSLAALVAFLLGAVVGGCLAARLGTAQRRWLLSILLAESGLFFLAAIGSSQFTASQLSRLGLQCTLIALTAAAMGLRNATVRRLGVPDMTTTVLTLTLTGLGADSSLAGGASPRWPRRLASVAAMLAGAAVGAILVLRSGLTLPLCLTGVVTLVAALGYFAWPEARVALPR